MKLRVAQLQTPVFAEPADTLAYVSRLLDTLEPVDLVMLPEMFCCPYAPENFPRYAQKEGEALWQTCSHWARDHKIYLCAGTVPERDDDGGIYNTSYMFDSWGKQIGKHRKIHLFDIAVDGKQHFRESDTLRPGQTVTVFDTSFGRMGLCICYDFRFPELARLMTLQGAQIILVPAAFNMTTGPCHWELMFRSRAVDNQVFTLGTAPARDQQAGYLSWGHTIAVDPWGRVLTQMQEQAGVQYVELFLQQVEDVRRQLPLLAHRRNDLYELRQKTQAQP